MPLQNPAPPMRSSRPYLLDLCHLLGLADHQFVPGCPFRTPASTRGNIISRHELGAPASMTRRFTMRSTIR